MRFSCVLCIALIQASPLPQGVTNTQPGADRPLSPQQALGRITVPEGFRVTLFAGEPDVAQPIALTFDDRGRLWVVECYSYPDWNRFEGRDRVLIFQDTDNDGRFDTRKVFLDNGTNLTGITLGFGGVWLCSAPNLLFVPDRDGDDRPDGPPQIKLDGWNYDKVQHNVFNGLTWGPDGWLYGCHGILAESRVGKPGVAEEQRTKLNCGIWRYHPIRGDFEVVAHGTTNPWGLDFNDYGEGFFANCVIEHMWRLIPGARYKRMYGQDYNPYSYELMGPCSDHLHWAGDDWTKAGRDGVAQTRLGGGHAHCGTMVYLGDSFPPEYRNCVYTCNIHGNRINRDPLALHGSGYVAHHGPDFMLANDPWFRGVALAYGPDGGVYVTDWNDLGECHDHDGVVRDSGRIYKITCAQPDRLGARRDKRLASSTDLTKLSDAQLADLHLHPNDYFVRHARRILQERAAAGQDLTTAQSKLESMLAHPDVTRGLRALWTLSAISALSPQHLQHLLESPDEHLRVWAIRVGLENPALVPIVHERLPALADQDPSPMVQLALACALQRTPLEDRLALAQRLASRTETVDDRDLSLMIWYGVEPAVAADPSAAVAFIDHSRLPMLRQNTARRLIEALPESGAAELARWLGASENAPAQTDVLRGMLAALEGRAVARPAAWTAVYARLSQSPQVPIRRMVRLVSLALGDVRAAAELGRLAADPSASSDERVQAIDALAQRKDPQLPPVLRQLITDRSVGGAALRGLAAYNDPATPQLILDHYAQIPDSTKPLAIAALSARPSSASALLEAVDQGRVPRSDISAFTAKQIHQLGDAALREKLARVWGVVQTTSQDKKRLMDKYKSMLSGDTLAKADPRNGRAVFVRTCSSCHKLFGQGGDIGPELTGSDRANLDYILGNVIDPSAVVGRDYQFTTLTTRDGRTFAGMIRRETPDAITIRTTTEQSVVPSADIASRTTLPTSIMPEGLLLTLTDNDVRDLIAYLASLRQVDTP